MNSATEFMLFPHFFFNLCMDSFTSPGLYKLWNKKQNKNITKKTVKIIKKYQRSESLCFYYLQLVL